MNNDIEQMSDDELLEYTGIMQDLARHPGYKMLMLSLQQEYQTLAATLLTANEMVLVSRTQGALRAIGNFLEMPGDQSLSLRQQIVDAMEIEQDQRKEEKQNAGY